MEGVFAPKTPISTANRSKPRALFGIILTCLNRELVFLLPKVKKREYFEFAWAHLAPKVIDSNGSHIGEGRIAYALHSVQTVMIGSLNTCIINASVCPGSKDQALLVQLEAPLVKLIHSLIKIAFSVTKVLHSQ